VLRVYLLGWRYHCHFQGCCQFLFTVPVVSKIYVFYSDLSHAAILLEVDTGIPSEIFAMAQFSSGNLSMIWPMISPSSIVGWKTRE
jgi:hypothetical protein